MRRRAIVPTEEMNGFAITLDSALESAMTPATKLIILNSPGNPTGFVYTREELQALAEVALEEDILMLLDEIAEKSRYDGAETVRPRSPAAKSTI